MLVLRNLELTELIDLLSEETMRYSKMMIDGRTDKEYASCKLIIAKLLAEIELRKSKGSQPVSNFPESSEPFIEGNSD